MKLPKMTPAEIAVLGAVFAREMREHAPTVDNAAAERSLDAALWEVMCFRQALRERPRK